MLVPNAHVLNLALIGIVIWQVFRSVLSRVVTQAVIAQGDKFHRLLDRSAESRAPIALETARISAEFREMCARIANMERRLRDATHNDLPGPGAVLNTEAPGTAVSTGHGLDRSRGDAVRLEPRQTTWR